MPNVVGSREGWKQYIVTGSMMAGILLSNIPILLPTILGTYLRRIMFDSMMMTF
jgi:hypothetical protein